jgi:succinate dehydrogenase/fumarate reductase flavoprotein subunit
MSQESAPIDLLVLGAGMAGLAAAARAAQEGASVVLVDKAPAVGGSAAYAGFIWTAPSVEVMREVNPDADPALSARLVEDYPAAIDWVRSLGVEVQEPVTLLGFGRGRETDMANLLMACERIVRDTDGCELLLRSHAERLLLEDGHVCGAEVVSSTGERREIRSRSTLLATGGFGGDPELRAQHIHPQARNLPLRANKYSTGDGLRLGLSAGAAFGPENAGFYGHLIASPVVYDNPYEFTDLTFYHSEHGVLLNLEGRRFYDETLGDHLSTLAVLEQPEARALLVTDQRVHDQWMMAPYVQGVEPIDKFALAYRRGARCAVADDLDELEHLPEEWGYPGPKSRAALHEFNRQCESGLPDPPRRLDAVPLQDPPFYVIEVVPAITFTFGGLLIDAEARVLDASGDPIPGLLAAGADAGGVFVGAYAGGLATALVFGLQAATTAVHGAAATAS